MGSEFIYDVYYTKNPESGWLKYNSIILDDDVIDEIYGSTQEDNIYNLENLDNNITYYIKIKCKDRYYQWWYSYTDYDSIDGGFGLSTNTPVQHTGNIFSFLINIIEVIKEV